MSTRESYALELDRVTKEFAGVRALDDASLKCLPGEVHALVGENGAGKSTLIKVAAGALSPDSGGVRICGEPLHPATVLRARRLGLQTAYQDTSLVSGLTVGENVLLSFRGGTERGARLSKAEIGKLLAPFDLPFAAGDRVGDLSPAARQLLEVVRAVIHEPRVLLLDEPTAALDLASTQQLEGIITEVKRRGVAILYISHRLDEVKRLADRVTVIRDGKIQGSFERGGWEVDDLVERMAGVRVDLAFPDKPGVDPDAPVRLAAENFHGSGFGPIDLFVRAGEIVGVAGAEGNGQRELIRSIVGLRRGQGSVRIDATAGPVRSPAEALRRGLSFSSGDREQESVFKELGVMENATLSVRGDLGAAGVIVRSRERSRFRPLAEKLGIVHASPYQPVGELSGGNQQKTVLARSLLGDAGVMVIDEPTAGVDARARLDIYRVIRAEAARGKAILINSSDATELQGLCDRVYALSRGRVAGLLSSGDVTEQRIVESFVNVEGSVAHESAGEERRAGFFSRLLGALPNPSWLPFLALVALTLAVGSWAALESPVFLGEANLGNLLLATTPLAAVALGQQAALISGGFDISVGSAISLTVVLASFWITGSTLAGSVPGILACLGVGIAIGLLNGLIVRVLKVSPIITTIATLGILQGVAVLLRPEPGGIIGFGIADAVSARIGFLPWVFLIVVAIALVAEIWLRRSSTGLALRAAGMSEEASRRTGVHIERIKIGGYVVCSVAAVVAGLLLAGQVGIGQSSAGQGFPLPAFAACFLGGAALAGGRGSFVGALIGALFLTMLVNVTPLLGLPNEISQMVTGVLTVVAVIAYSIPVLSRRSSPTRTPRKPGSDPFSQPTAVGSS